MKKSLTKVWAKILKALGLKPANYMLEGKPVEEDDAITIVKYQYEIGDLVELRIYNSNTKSHNTIIGIVVKRYLLNHFWFKEAKKQIRERGKDFLIIYDIICDSDTYTVREKEIIKLASRKEAKEEKK